MLAFSYYRMYQQTDNDDMFMAPEFTCGLQLQLTMEMKTSALWKTFSKYLGIYTTDTILRRM